MRYAGGLAGRRLVVAVRGRPGRGQVRRRASRAQLREPQSRQHAVGEVVSPVREHRHRAAALSRVRALVGRVLSLQRGGDPLDRQQPLRRQQAVVGRGAARAPAATSISSRSSSRSSSSRRWATTSRRRSRRSTGSPTSIRRPRKSRPTARRSSACCTRTSAISASSCPGKVAKKEHAQIVEVLKYIQQLPPGLYGMHIEEHSADGRRGQVRGDAHRAQGRGPAHAAARTIASTRSRSRRWPRCRSCRSARTRCSCGRSCAR